jgi:hypothetical protein
LPPESVVLVLDDAPLSMTGTSLIPDTTPEMLKVELVLVLVTVLEPELVPVGAAVVPVIAVELPPHAARNMQARNASAANKRVDWIMNFPWARCEYKGRVLWEMKDRRKVSLGRDQIDQRVWQRSHTKMELLCLHVLWQICQRANCRVPRTVESHCECEMFGSDERRTSTCDLDVDQSRCRASPSIKTREAVRPELQRMTHNADE